MKLQTPILFKCCTAGVGTSGVKLGTASASRDILWLTANLQAGGPGMQTAPAPLFPLPSQHVQTTDSYWQAQLWTVFCDSVCVGGKWQKSLRPQTRDFVQSSSTGDKVNGWSICR